MPRKKPPEVKNLYYITHVENLPSIFSNGILSHAQVHARGIPFTPVYDASIVAGRQARTAGGRSLWEYANLYFQARNPMLFRVLHEKDLNEIVVLGIEPSVLATPSAFVALGNAASASTPLLPAADGIRALPEIWDSIQSEWWNAVDGSKRRIMAECLIPTSISPDFIDSVYVASHDAAQRVRSMAPARVAVVPEPRMFFRPLRRIAITDHLFLADGDMFFSTLQTLTVSVNTVGIMGKGLASRAKYQFPDVYVAYQDACRRKRLRMGQPYLYKREAFLDVELADDPQSLQSPNARKWFLLFATKKHWRERSDLAGIEAGLKWISDNYEAEGIQSLAIPALGCGLGRLDWCDVGPVMCQILAKVRADVAIYLPREATIAEDHLTRAFLLDRAHYQVPSGAV